MSDCDFEDEDLIDGPDDLLTEAEFFGYQTPKGRQILLHLGSERALSILITSPSTPLDDALRLSTQLTSQFAGAELEGIASALFVKGLSFTHFVERPFLANSIALAVNFADYVLEERRETRELRQLLQHIYITLDWVRTDNVHAQLLYVIHQSRVLLAEDGAVNTPLDLWERLLVDLMVVRKTNIVLLAAKKAAVVNELIVTYCICTDDYEQAWELLVGYLCATSRLEAHTPRTVDLLHGLEILAPRHIDPSALLMCQSPPSREMRELLHALNDNEPTADRLRRAEAVQSDNPITCRVQRQVILRLTASCLEDLCAPGHAPITVEHAEAVLGSPLHQFAQMLPRTTQIVGAQLEPVCMALEVEQEATRLLGARFDALSRPRMVAAGGALHASRSSPIG